MHLAESEKCSEKRFDLYIYISTNTILRVTKHIWRVQMQKPLSAIWNFLLKWSFLSNLYI